MNYELKMLRIFTHFLLIFCQKAQYCSALYLLLLILYQATSIFRISGMFEHDLLQQADILAQHKPRQQSVQEPALRLISLQQFVFSDV